MPQSQDHESKAAQKLATLKEPDPCTCATCVEMCDRPCWPTPAEAKAIIDAGFGDKLMLDEWVSGGEIPGGAKLLCGANPGHEGQAAPFDPRQGCSFFADGLCQLHSPGLKPSEGRLARHDHPHDHPAGALHLLVAKTWATTEGRELVESWCADRGLDPDEDDYDIGDYFNFLGTLL